MQRSAALADVRAKLGLGQCDMDLARQVLTLEQPEIEQEAAYACLQQGKPQVVDTLLADYQKRYTSPPHPDYSAYLLALNDFLRFESAVGDSRQRLILGRAAHAKLVGFVRDFPGSDYRSEVAPRLEAIHQGLATAEYELARLAAENGDVLGARARMEYVVRQYPRSDAAKDARAWMQLTPE